MDLWELVARERVRDTLARYSWSGDSLRLDELAAAFCEDGVLEVRGQPPVTGRAAIVAFLSGVGPDGLDRSVGPPADGAAAPGDAVAVDDEARRAARRAEAEASGVRRIVRHLVTNTRFVELSPERALVSSYFTVITERGLDHHGRYRDELVPVGDEWLIRRRQVSTDWRDPGSVMAPPSSIG